MSVFIMEYQALRKQGYTDLEAFGLVSGRIANEGSFKDLQVLYGYHLNDFMQETKKVFNEVEELNHETA